MRRLVVFLGLLIFVSAVVVAQKPPTARPTAATVASAANKFGMIPSGTVVTGELQTSLDSKTAKVGDLIVLKTTNVANPNGTAAVPAGKKLIGRVTEVQSAGMGTASTIGLVFDKLQQGNKSDPFSAIVISIKHRDGSTIALDERGVTSTSEKDLETVARTTGGKLTAIRMTPSAGSAANGAATLSREGGDVRIEKGAIFNLRVN